MSLSGFHGFGAWEQCLLIEDCYSCLRTRSSVQVEFSLRCYRVGSAIEFVNRVEHRDDIFHRRARLHIVNRIEYESAAAGENATTLQNRREREQHLEDPLCHISRRTQSY